MPPGRWPSAAGGRSLQRRLARSSASSSVVPLGEPPLSRNMGGWSSASAALGTDGSFIRPPPGVEDCFERSPRTLREPAGWPDDAQAPRRLRRVEASRNQAEIQLPPTSPRGSPSRRGPANSKTTRVGSTPRPAGGTQDRRLDRASRMFEARFVDKLLGHSGLQILLDFFCERRPRPNEPQIDWAARSAWLVDFARALT